MLSPDTIAINRLRIQGDKRSGQKLAGDIMQTSWARPLPIHLQQAWIFVRQIRVSGKLYDLRHQTAHALDSNIQRAVSARDSHSPKANAIWFESFPVLLAFLLHDLAMGQASRWYWDKWSYLLKYPRDEAITRLLCEYPEYIVSTIAELIKTHHLSSILTQLNSQSAMTVAHELMRCLQIPKVNGNPTKSINPSTYIAISTKLAELSPRISEWKIASTNKQSEREQSELLENGHRLLASLYIGLHFTPLFLYQETNTFFHVMNDLFSNTIEINNVYLQQITKIDTSFTAKLDRENPEISYPLFQSSATTEDENIIEKSHMISTHINSDNSIFSKKNRPSFQDLVTLKLPPDNILYSSNEEHLLIYNTDNVSTEIKYIHDEIISNEYHSGVDLLTEAIHFISMLGGFFYLLNPINRLLLDSALEKPISPNAWNWLLDIYYLFKKHYGIFSTLNDTALSLFLVHQLHPEINKEALIEKEKELQLQKPHPFSCNLFQQLKDTYGEEPFWKELKEGKGFLATQAQIIATASHIDVYYSLQSTRLDLRLAAWDVNPGWLPWLGRVVKFHYLENHTNNANPQG